MNPCPENKKLIACLALDELDERAARSLRAHLDACAGCREYWEQLATVCREHSIAAGVPMAATAGHSFHQRLSRRIREDQEASVSPKITSFLRRWLFERYAVIPMTAAVVALIFIFARDGTRHNTPVTPVIATQATPVRPEISPTLSAYRAAANDSLEALDELLTKEAAQQTGHAETLTMFAFRKIDSEN